MAKLMITTQVYENYACSEGLAPYWKAKGGNEYVVKNIDPNRAADIVNWACGEVEQDTLAFQETVIHWQVVEDDHLTDFERSQLEYEGKIIYPAQELVMA